MSLLVVPTFLLAVVWASSTWLVLSTGKAILPLHGWMMGLSFFVVLPLVIIVLNGGYTVPSYYGVEGRWGSINLADERFLVPYFFVWLNLLLVAITAALLCRGRIEVERLDAQLEFSETRIKRAVLACTFLMLLDISLNIFMRGGIRNYFILHWYTRNADSLESYGEVFVIYQFLNLGFQLVLTAVTCLCALRKMQTSRGGWPLAVALATMVLNMIVSGNRIYIALLLLYVSAAAIQTRRYRAIAKMALMVPFLVVAFAVWAQIRGALSDPVSAISRHVDSARSYEGNYVLNRVIDVTEGTNIIVLLNITKDFGERYQYLSGLTFLKSVTFWIPRSIYPNKPESFPVITAKLYEPGAETSISSTILGELYANFGCFTLVLLPLLTVLIYAVDRWVSQRMSWNYVLGTALFLMFAWMARASFSDNLLMMGFSVLFIWGLRLQSGLLVAKVCESRTSSVPGNPERNLG